MMSKKKYKLKIPVACGIIIEKSTNNIPGKAGYHGGIPLVGLYSSQIALFALAQKK